MFPILSLPWQGLYWRMFSVKLKFKSSVETKGEMCEEQMDVHRLLLIKDEFLVTSMPWICRVCAGGS
jgi:hypothetical protein